ncbi:hypothetical protein [Longispora albida]|uniref:hypothetical protein n=1 Tax=Longispora albida TaxID=203523 RepID=UPI00037700B2|nr:hypothetical protein [Longispora albida]
MENESDYAEVVEAIAAGSITFAYAAPGMGTVVDRSILLTADADARIEAAAARRGVEPSALIRSWIDQGLAKES